MGNYPPNNYPPVNGLDFGARYTVIYYKNYNKKTPQNSIGIYLGPYSIQTSESDLGA